MDLTYEVDSRALTQGLKDIFKKQLPYARALALTADAYDVQVAWKDRIKSDLKDPTPFTVNSVAVIAARKSSPMATVLIKDIAAAYLEPFVDGGKHALGQKRGLLTPKNVPLNAYGNLPRNKLAALKAKKDVFVGPVKLKSGVVVNGVWQRGQRGERRKGGYGTMGSHHVKHNEKMGLVGYNNRTTLKLLVRFTDALPVTQHLPLYEETRRVVERVHERNFDKAWQLAVTSAK